MSPRGGVDVAGTGFAVMDLVYEGQTKLGKSLGGSCANVLWSLAMLDRLVVPVLNLGADDVADELVASFHEAGADTSYIARKHGRRSPILVQYVNAQTGWHSFSSFSPETRERLPRYMPIEREEVNAASAVFRSCSVLYVDRTSGAVVDAMESTAAAGGTVFFEPSAVGDEVLFRRAVQASTIVKFSSERLGETLLPHLNEGNVFAVVTLGSAGLDIYHHRVRVRCDAVPAVRVRDTSGAGDMVSVGLINWLLARRVRKSDLTLEDLVAGATAGQRLAAVNCSFVGARGIFTHLGAASAKRVLSGLD